jgi:inosine/xanthosine triphosphatase
MPLSGHEFLAKMNYTHNMKRVIVASKNPVKIKAATDGFQRLFPDQVFTFAGVDVLSGVSEQPFDDEILVGAENRMQAAYNDTPDADYWVGIEGGAEKTEHGMMVYAWIAIRDVAGTVGRGRTSALYLPPAVARLVAGGMELGLADDKVFGQTNSKQAGGAVGLLTRNAITRTDYYTEAVILAAVPFKNPEFYL